MIHFDYGTLIQFILTLRQGGFRNGALKTYELIASQNKTLPYPLSLTLEGLTFENEFEGKSAPAIDPPMASYPEMQMLQSRRLQPGSAASARDKTVRTYSGGGDPEKTAVKPISRTGSISRHQTTAYPGRKRTISWLTASLVGLLIVVLVVIPVAAAANVQVLWSNETSLQGLRFGDFDGDGSTDVFRISGNQWEYSSGGTGAWQDLYADPLSTALDDLRFGDFNGDGRTDVFSVSGTQWQYSSAGISNWIPLATDSTPLADLRFGDFNGDGRTDVFGVSGMQWRYSASGASNWINLASDSTPVQDLRFGDFNGDGRTDVFSMSGTQWRYSASGTSNWILLATDSTPLVDLRFGDFDRDGTSDIFSISGTQWRYSSGGVSNWVPLATDSTPLSQLRFGDFNGDQRTDVFSISGSQWRYSSGGASNWINLNQVGPTATPTNTPVQTGAVGQLRFGDFDGDSRTDVFRTQNGQWQFSSAGTGAWQNLAWDSLPLAQLRFGDATWVYRNDFNGDGRTDVFSVSGTQWRYSSGGASSWIDLASDPTPLDELRFGDFDGNGRTDVFSTLNGQWRYSPDGTSNWVPLATDSRTIGELRFGDFNGDGRTDVFSISGTQWQYSSAGISSWIPLATDSTPLDQLRFGDFNGDGTTDVFSISGTQWRYSAGGTSNWINLATDATPLAQLRFGDFNGDGRTDVFSVNSNGRWQYSSGGTSNWILLGPPNAVTATPTNWPTTWPTPTNWPPPTGWPTFYPPPTIPVTPVPPLPGDCINIAVNSDMEREGGWMFGDSPYPASYTGAQKRSGLRSIRLGITPEMGGPNGVSYSSVRQPITLPGNTITAQLRWWHLYRTQESADPNPSNQSDRQEVILLTPNGKTLSILTRVRRNDATWQEESIDLTEYIGQTFYIYFNTYNDGNGARTWMFLDDVTVDVCSQPPMPSPYSGQQSSGGQSSWEMQSQPGGQPYGAMQPYTESQAYGSAQPYSDGQAYMDGQPYTDGQPYAEGQAVPAYGENQPYMDGQPSMEGQPYSGAETYEDGQAYAGTPPASQPPTGMESSEIAPVTDTPAPTETPYPTSSMTLSPTPTETATPTGVAAGETPETGENVEGEQAPAIAAATQLPAIPPDAIEAKVLRVLDGEVFEVVIEGDMDPDAVDDPSAPGVIPANFITRMGVGLQFAGWRARSQTSTQIAQAEATPSTVLIRYADIETPALDTQEGEVAATANRELIDGQTVFLEIADPNPDAEGVVSAFVFLEDGELANAVMVREGHAVVSPTASDSRYEARLIAAQTEAQETGSGMWALTPATNDEVALAPPATGEATADTAPSATPSSTGEAESPDLTQSNGCVELVRNGGFEEGATHWNLIDGERPPEITDAITFGESNYALQLGIVDGENVASISAADQLIELPADADSIVLSLRYFPIADSDPGPGDLQYVDVYNAQTGQFAGRVLSGQRDDAVWLAANYDMSQLAGQPVRIVFAVNNDGVAGSTAVIVDDVSILACKLPGETGTRSEPQAEPDSNVEGAGAEAQATVETVQTTESEKTQLTAGPPWLVKMFTGAVMLGILTVIGFAALVIMNSSTPGSSGGGSKDSGGD